MDESHSWASSITTIVIKMNLGLMDVDTSMSWKGVMTVVEEVEHPSGELVRYSSDPRMVKYASFLFGRIDVGVQPKPCWTQNKKLSLARKRPNSAADQRRCGACALRKLQVHRVHAETATTLRPRSAAELIFGRSELLLSGRQAGPSSLIASCGVPNG